MVVAGVAFRAASGTCRRRPRLWARLPISAAICSGVSTQSTQPASMADWGMPVYLAESGCWAKVKPPAALISRSPAVPSDPVPDRITPTESSAMPAASDEKKAFTDGLGRASRSVSTTRRQPFSNSTLRPAGAT